MGQKFYDENSIGAIAAAIRGKNGTQNTYTVAQMATAIDNIPTGITPTGSVTLDANGTYDVTDKASAIVSVLATAKCFVKTFDSDQSGTHVTFNPLGDAEIAAHRTDSTFVVGFIATSSTHDTSTRASFVGANTMHTGNSAYGMYLRSSSAGVSGQLVQKLVTAPQAQTAGTITVDNNGIITAYASSSYPIRAGDYIVICGW